MNPHNRKFRRAASALAFCLMVCTPIVAQQSSGSGSNSAADRQGTQQSTSGQTGSRDLNTGSTSATPGSRSGATGTTATGTDGTVTGGTGLSNPHNDGRSTDQLGSATQFTQQQARRADDVLGQKVRGDNGEEIGTISDLVIDGQSGQIRHAVIRAGGFLGIGGTTKAVPFDSLQMSSASAQISSSQDNQDDAQQGFTLAQNEWESAQEFREDQLASLSTSDQSYRSGTSSTMRDSSDAAASASGSSAGMGTTGSASGAGQSQVASSAGGTQSGSADTSDNAGTAAMSDRSHSFVLASKLEGMPLRSQDRELGEVQGAVIHADQKKASLLVEVNAQEGALARSGEDDIADNNATARAMGDQLFVVGFDQITVGGSGDDRTLTTQLSETDFSGATSGQATADSGRPYRWTQDMSVAE